MSTDTSIQRQAGRARSLRLAAACGALVNVFLIVADLASGAGSALIPAAVLAVFLVLALMSTRTIRTLERVRELNRHAGRLELAAKVLTPATRPSCAHASAEPVDLFNPSSGKYDGERVGWVCPDCNTDLPAGWTPAEKVLRGKGDLPDCKVLSAEGHFPGCDAPSGTGSLSARARHYGGTYQSNTVYYAGGPGGPATSQGGGGGTGGTVFAYPPPPPPDAPSYALARSDREIAGARAAEHFAALARVGLEHCASYCPICLHRLFGPVPDGWPTASLKHWLEENWGWKQ